MSSTGNEILIKFKRRWLLLLWLEIFLFALGAAVFVYFLSLSFALTAIFFLLTAGIMILVLKPWKISLQMVSGHLDQKLKSLEYSSGLLLMPSESLSGLGKLQQQRVANQLGTDLKRIQPENNLLRAAVISVLLVASGVVIDESSMLENFETEGLQNKKSNEIIFHPADSLSAEIIPPRLEDQRVTISYPAYTGIPAATSKNMNIKAVEGSRVFWEINFDRKIDSALMESMGNIYPMNLQKGSYNRTSVLGSSGFYNFRFTDTTGGSYVSDLYSIEVAKDKEPKIKIENLQQFTSFEYDERKGISFNALITDDFGVANAYIIATVSKGTGEAVKFREEKLEFESSVKKGKKRQELLKKLDLDSLKMGPGDELYFYIEATDLKQPQPNIARSETFFAVIKDTVSHGEGVEGTLGVDLMPDYFRSQRQLIIDTKKLISQRNKIPTKEFNSTSNNLGFDQKALRLKYGQFMGDESEEQRETLNTAEETENEDPLAEFRHDHDSENEHNLVEQDRDHEEEEEKEEKKDPLAEFLHDHGDPESATLFTDSLKSKLRQALNIMWDAELHLRLNEPEKSLPYQYRALALIQDIKNSARIYVHRIGYEPAPIKEDKRLTGKLDEVSNFWKTEELQKADKFKNIRQTVEKLEQLLNGKAQVTSEDQNLFKRGGDELAAIAIEEPGKHLKTLRQLKWLTEEREATKEEMTSVLRGLLQALPKPEANPGKTGNFAAELNELLIKEMEKNDQ